jgi:hypothetical protein
VSGQYAYVEAIAQPTDFNGKEYEVEVIDANTFDLVGQSTTGVAAYTSGGKVSLSENGIVYEDTVTNAALESEEYTCSTTEYAIAPLAKFERFIKKRMWLWGVPNESMKAFYSEDIGGDGGTPLKDAIVYPQKYASLFKYNNAVVCNASAGEIESGIEGLGDDVYFFSESSAFALFGGDPTQASPIKIADYGCVFPYATVMADIPYFGGRSILFFGNIGPAVIKMGGSVMLFTQFKIAQFWPEKSRELYGDLDTDKRTIQQNCSAVFHDNEWIISYKNAAGVSKTFSYYFDPDLRYDEKLPHGPYQIESEEI